MVRIIVQRNNANMAAHVGGNVEVSYSTFDIDSPELESYLQDKGNGYESRWVVGAEVLIERKGGEA